MAGAYDRIIWAPECLSDLLLQVCLLKNTRNPSGPAPFHACNFPLGFSHGFHCNGGFTFMWWLLGAALQGLWCCYTLSGVSSSVHGTSTQDSLLTQWTTIFNACKTCTKWLMLIRSGASLRSSLSTLDHSCIIHSLCAPDPGETLPQWLFSNRKLYVPIRFLMFCFVFVFDIRFHYIALPGQL